MVLKQLVVFADSGVSLRLETVADQAAISSNTVSPAPLRIRGSTPYNGYLRTEIFSSLGTRYGGDPVYDQYLSYCGLKEYDDAIDTPFHLNRKQRLAAGYDDYPDQYP